MPYQGFLPGQFGGVAGLANTLKSWGDKGLASHFDRLRQ